MYVSGALDVETSYTKAELMEMLGLKDPAVRYGEVSASDYDILVNDVTFKILTFVDRLNDFCNDDGYHFRQLQGRYVFVSPSEIIEVAKNYYKSAQKKIKRADRLINKSQLKIEQLKEEQTVRARRAATNASLDSSLEKFKAASERRKTAQDTNTSIIPQQYI